MERCHRALGVLALVVALGLEGCSLPSGPDARDAGACDGSSRAGELVLWTSCPVQPLGGYMPFQLTNLTEETVWLFHECGDEVPWLERLQPDGTWQRLLPEDFYLTTECGHVHELLPGESVEMATSTHRASGPGEYRVQIMVAYGCTHVHEPLHLPHSCARMDFVSSAPVELR